MLHFVIPGKPVTGNLARRYENGRAHLTNEARAFRERVKGHAFAAIRAQGWRPPEYVRLDVTLWNIRQDRDNAVKELQDALQQAQVYPDDGRILDGWIIKRKDKGEQRIEVTVQVVDPTLYGYR